jgi:hypothetical protein
LKEAEKICDRMKVVRPAVALARYGAASEGIQGSTPAVANGFGAPRKG